MEIGVAIGLNRLRWPFLLKLFLRVGCHSISSSWWFSAPLAVELSLPVIEPGYGARWRLVSGTLFSSRGSGLAFAHLLHFAEVCACRRSLSRAIADLRHAARFRAAGEHDLENGWGGTVVSNLSHQLFWGHPFDSYKFLFLGLPLGALWVVVALVFLTFAVLGMRGRSAAFDLLGRWPPPA